MGARGRRTLALTIFALTFLLAGTAQAATVRLGSTLQGMTDAPSYSPPGTLFIQSLAAPLIAASPVDGTVVNWSFIGSATGPFVPRIVRSAGAGTFTGAGTGTGQSGAGVPAIAGPFPTSLPIRKGDFFGVNPPDMGVIGYRAGAGAGTGTLMNPPVVDGGPGVASFTSFSNEEDMISATVRYCLVPKLKGKSPKAARNALMAADCAVGKVKKTKKERKKKQVLTQSVAAGSSISDTQGVNLKLSRKQK